MAYHSPRNDAIERHILEHHRGNIQFDELHTHICFRIPERCIHQFNSGIDSAAGNALQPDLTAMLNRWS